MSEAGEAARRTDRILEQETTVVAAQDPFPKGLYRLRHGRRGEAREEVCVPEAADVRLKRRAVEVDVDGA